MARRAQPVAPTTLETCVPRADLLARAFKFLGKRWSAVVLGHLSHGAMGFSDLTRAIGISPSMLSDRLSELSDAGLIERTVNEGPPLAVSYELTDRGRALMPALEQISIWAAEHLAGEQEEAT